MPDLSVVIITYNEASNIARCIDAVRSLTDDIIVIDHNSTDNEIKHYQQSIFADDKPILENQYPKRLPLDPRAETPIRADNSAIAYRRWLTDLGVSYGVIPA